MLRSDTRSMALRVTRAWLVLLLFLAVGPSASAQLANLSCGQTWYYTSYGISSFKFNGTTVSSGVNWPSIAATVGTGNTNMSNSFSVVPGQTCTFQIIGQLTYYNCFGLYIDWNNNGTFETSEYITNLVGYYSNNYSGAFTVPAGVTPGPKRMRVNWDYYYGYYYYGIWGPCRSYASGQTQYYGDCEDYLLNVGYQNDAALTGISTSTAPPFPAGTNNITATIKNNGVNTITGFTMDYTVTPSTGSTISGTISSNTTLANGASTTVILVSGYDFPAVGSATVSASIATVNSTNDGNTSNNSSSALFGAGLNGTYTVGGSSPDFSSIAQAAAQLTAGGTMGPVTFNIRPGTYTENVYIANIPGSLSTRPVVFQSENGNKNSVVLQYSNTSAAAMSGTTSIGNTPALRMNNADYVTLKNFSITSLNSSSGLGNAIELVGATGGASGCDYVTFDNMVFNGVSSTSSAIGDVFMLSTNAGYHQNLSVTNCTFNNSATPFYHVKSSTPYAPNMVLSANTFTDFGYSAGRIDGTDGAIVNGNSWTAVVNPISSGLNLFNHNGPFNFRKNRINVVSSIGAAALSSLTRTTTNQAIIANNFIRVAGASVVGINCSATSNVGIFHNTVYQDGNGSAFTASSATTNAVTNNIFINAGTGLAFAAVSGVTANYNDYYSVAGNVASWNGTAYATMAAYQAASGQDAKSSNVLPTLADAANNNLSLTFVDPLLYGVGSTSNGTYNSGLRNTIQDDIFGNNRSTRSEIFMGAHQLVPVISFNPAPPATLSGCANQTLTISANAVVSFGAQLSYSWQRNGAPLLDGVNGVSGASTNTLTITNAQPSLNGGDYVLRVTATGGADPLISNIISVNVNAPIEINQQPSPRIICQGSETSMAVVASGTILGYQWQKDGVNIAGATGPILVINNAGFQQSGRYRVVMTGTCGTTTVASNDAAVVIASNTLIGTNPEINGAAVGSTGYLSVEVNATAKPNGYSPSFQWYHGASKMVDDGRVSGVTTSQLTIRNMQTADITKDYYCVVTGICGSQSSAQGGFYVSQISIQNQPSSQEVCSSSDASLMVSASSNIPNVVYSYQWKKNGTNVSNSSMYQGATTNVLTIKGATAAEAGDYTCLVTANPTGANLLSQPATISQPRRFVKARR